MKISDQGIILSARKYSENSLIVKILSHEHGIYSGFIKGVSNKKNARQIYQASNLVQFDWQARLSEQLGFFKIELLKSFLGDILFSKIKLEAVNNITFLIESNILDREPHPELYQEFLGFLKISTKKDNSQFLVDYIKLELNLLQDLGYGIDLSRCAVTDKNEDLCFVSPKSGRAVSSEGAGKYADRLLKLPSFLTKNDTSIQVSDLDNGLTLSEFFIKKHLFKEHNCNLSHNFKKLDLKNLEPHSN